MTSYFGFVSGRMSDLSLFVSTFPFHPVIRVFRMYATPPAIAAARMRFQLNYNAPALTESKIMVRGVVRIATINPLSQSPSLIVHSSVQQFISTSLLQRKHSQEFNEA